MSEFRPLKEHELAALPDERLLEHLVLAREAGEPEQALLALRILAFGNLTRVRGWVGLKVPRSDVDDVAAAVLESAIAGALRAPFEGRVLGEFRAWLHVIARRRIADYHRKRERAPEEAPLPEEHTESEEIYGVAGASPDGTDAVFTKELIAAVIAELSDTHRLGVELAGATDLGFEGRPAKEAAAIINDQLSLSGDDSMSDVNLHQILSRFRRRCRELYEQGDSDG